jgi:putative ABC transport system permease protein
MIRHIFKIIWNERRVNAWLMLEYILVFCVLWFCVDFLSTTARTYLESMGYDIKHTYMIRMGTKEAMDIFSSTESADEDEYAQAMLFLERVAAYPAVEAVGLSSNGAPYSMGSAGSTYTLPDSSRVYVESRNVSSGFYDVFRIPLVRGNRLPWPDDSKRGDYIIAPDRNGMIGTVQVSELGELALGMSVLNVVGYTPPLKNTYYEPATPSRMQTLTSDRMKIGYVEKTMRVRPEYDNRDFPERFLNDMAEQLNIGNYYLEGIIPYSEIAKDVIRKYGQRGKINSVMAITAFLIINIFLGILGSFWFRTQSRQSEIGLRMALGASGKRIKAQFLGETMLLLSLASVVATLICLHIGSTELLQDLNILITNREDMGIGNEQYFINFGLTFLFLALVSALAVWYPARQSSRIQPAEALRDE